jgi:nucleoside-diphosphate-sugar epimerase
MKVLVIGASSALAHHLIPLLEPVAEVITAGRKGAQYHLDLATHPDTWDFPSGIDTVVNLAAHFGGIGIANLVAAQNVNTQGVLHLTEVCQASSVKHLIHVSTIFSTLPVTSPFYSAYSLTKRQGEELAYFAARNTELALTILRPSQLYGPVARFRRLQPFFYTVLSRAASNQEILFHGSHDAVRNFIHVDDVAQMIALCVERPVEGIFNCAAQENLTYGQLARTAIDAFGSRSKIRFDSKYRNTPDNGFVLDELLYRHLDFFPRISLADGISRLTDELHLLRDVS